ncbi:MAG TPA: hypothetical protein VJ325_04380, partial [Thiobacillus sp.]|nr:hypothetical protein [Thiobacillus sp.]
QLIEDVKSLQECITQRLAITLFNTEYSRFIAEQISLPGRCVKSNRIWRARGWKALLETDTQFKKKIVAAGEPRGLVDRHSGRLAGSARSRMRAPGQRRQIRGG